MKLRILAGGTLVIIIASLTTAFASPTGLKSKAFGAGDVSVASCAGTSFSPNFVYTKDASGLVTSVTVSNIPATCGAGSLSLILSSTTGTSIGTGGPATIPSGAGSSCPANSPCTQVVAIPATPSAANVGGVHVLIIGP